MNRWRISRATHHNPHSIIFFLVYCLTTHAVPLWSRADVIVRHSDSPSSFWVTTHIHTHRHTSLPPSPSQPLEGVYLLHLKDVTHRFIIDGCCLPRHRAQISWRTIQAEHNASDRLWNIHSSPRLHWGSYAGLQIHWHIDCVSKIPPWARTFFFYVVLPVEPQTTACRHGNLSKCRPRT